MTTITMTLMISLLLLCFDILVSASSLQPLNLPLTFGPAGEYVLGVDIVRPDIQSQPFILTRLPRLQINPLGCLFQQAQATWWSPGPNARHAVVYLGGSPQDFSPETSSFLSFLSGTTCLRRRAPSHCIPGFRMLLC